MNASAKKHAASTMAHNLCPWLVTIPNEVKDIGMFYIQQSQFLIEGAHILWTHPASPSHLESLKRSQRQVWMGQTELLQPAGFRNTINEGRVASLYQFKYLSFQFTYAHRITKINHLQHPIHKQLLFYANKYAFPSLFLW
jgi:hypothetical protein